MSVLICGSIAYDTIMVFHDHFRNHILPDKIHILNVSFLVPDLRKEFGGCAGNIAYNLCLLGEKPRIMATVGKDFAPYAHWLEKHGVDLSLVKIIDAEYTAQAYITTDQGDNQITAFHPGAMNYAHLNQIKPDRSLRLGLVSPDGRQGMIEHAQQFVHAGIPFIFDPGQGMPMFNGDELQLFIKQADYITLNDYEAELMQARTGWNLKKIARQVEALIVTKGAEGSIIYAGDQQWLIPPAPVNAVVDPTGCGDAYRAGLVYGLLHDLDWETTGRIAALMGAIKVEVAGTQNHRFTPEQFEQRFEQAFGFSLKLPA